MARVAVKSVTAYLGLGSNLGCREENLATAILGLSEGTANSVAGHLLSQGIHYTRITAVGYGESHPVASNNDVSGRSQNRRVDLLLKAKAR